MNDKNNKPFSVGVSIETPYFNADGGTGFNLSSFAGRLQFGFWEKGKTVTDDNRLSLNPSQVYTLYMNLKNQLTARQTAWMHGGAESYTDFKLPFVISGVVDNQNKVFGEMLFSTVPVNGIKRVQVSLMRNGTQSTVVLCDKGGCVTSGKSAVDEAEGSFARLVNDLEAWLWNTWNFGGFSKVVSTITGGGKGGHSTPSQQRSAASDDGDTPW